MEDLKQRLYFDNPVIKTQAVRKLLLKIAEHHDWKTASTTGSGAADLALFWSCCSGQDAILSEACCSHLVQLVTSGEADPTYALTSLINATPSAKSCLGIIRAVADLVYLKVMVVDVQMTSLSDYRSPFSIRKCPHPFVSIATNRTDSWPILLQQILRLLKTYPQRIGFTLEVMRPFLQFILLEPSQSTAFVQLRLALPAAILQVSGLEEGGLQLAVHFFLRILPSAQIRTLSSAGETMALLQTVAMSVRQCCAEVSGECMAEVGSHCLVLSIAGQRQGLDVSLSVEMAHQLRLLYGKAFCGQADLLHLLDLLMTAHYGQLLVTVLQIVNLILETDRAIPGMLSAMLLLPVLRILATPCQASSTTTQKQVTWLARQTLTAVEAAMMNSDSHAHSQGAGRWSFAMTPEAYTTRVYSQLLLLFTRQPTAAGRWLAAVQSGPPGHVTQRVTCLVAAIFVSVTDTDVESLCLKTLVEISQKEPTQAPDLLPLRVLQAPDLLPLLIYKLNREKSPHRKIQILETIPRLATHKVAVGQILCTLQSFSCSGAPVLQALALRLVGALWQQQDCCFPFLQKMITAVTKSPVATTTNRLDEVLLAAAVAIKDVCQFRPHQHGADMLTPLSAILEECTAESEAVVVATALDGLYFLCDAAVIDIRTAWSAIACRLQNDQRLLVIRAVCRLFCLVTKSQVATHEYEVFMAKAVEILWRHTQCTDDETAGAAYGALANFPAASFLVSHLPPEITRSLRDAAALVVHDESTEPVVPEISGDCYTKILMRLHLSQIPAFGRFLRQLVSEEVERTPRGAHHTRSKHRAVTRTKTLAAIPAFLQVCHNRDHQPGMRASFAHALLLTFDPPVSLARDGQPHKQHLVQHGNLYHQTLYTLLNEVPNDASRWRDCLYVPDAWTSFMNRCYIAYVDGQRAALQLKLQLGNVNDPEENEREQRLVWLWCRDKLTDLIKSTSRGTPTVQGNAVFTLAGLAVTVAKYASGLDDVATATDSTGYVGMPQWIVMVTNTLMSIADVNFRPTSRILPMCKQRSEGGQQAVSAVARGSAAVALAQLVPVLALRGPDVLYAFLDLLCGALTRADPTRQDAVHHALGLGLVISKLFTERFVDVAGTRGMAVVWKMVATLEKNAFGSSRSRTGSLLGVGVCLAAMSVDGSPTARTHVTQMQEQLLLALQMNSPMSDDYADLCMCLAIAMANAFASNICCQEAAASLMRDLFNAMTNSPEDAVVGCSVGLLGNCLLRSNHGMAVDLLRTLTATWLTSLQDEGVSTACRLVAMNVLAGLAGAHSSLVLFEQAPSEEIVSQCVNSAELVKILRKFVGGGYDLELGTRGATCLAQLHYAALAVSSADSRASVPTSYSYLAETSVLRAVTDVLLLSAKSDASGVEATRLAVCLASLLGKSSAAVLPPINWAGLLTPLLRMSLGDEVPSLCLEVAIGQSASSPSAALFVSAWILPPLYSTLPVSAKTQILHRLPLLIKSLQIRTCQEFLSQSFAAALSDDTCCPLLAAALTGLRDALALVDPPEGTSTMLHVALENVCHVLADRQLEASANYLLCECIAQLPDTMMDRMLEAGCARLQDPGSAGLFLRCYLVAAGHQPFGLLNPAIEASSRADHNVRGWSLSLLVQCFQGCLHGKDGSSNVLCQLQWLLELMGHVARTVETTVVTDTTTQPPTQKQTEYLMAVFAAAVVVWSGRSLVLGLSPLVRKASEPLSREVVMDDNECPFSMHRYQDEVDGECLLINMLWALLPDALEALMKSEPWITAIGKVIDWLLTLHEATTTEISRQLKDIIKSCLYSLRHCAEFERIDTWPSVVCLH